MWSNEAEKQTRKKIAILKLVFYEGPKKHTTIRRIKRETWRIVAEEKRKMWDKACKKIDSI